jgi:hypothetical protein
VCLVSFGVWLLLDSLRLTFFGCTVPLKLTKRIVVDPDAHHMHVKHKLRHWQWMVSHSAAHACYSGTDGSCSGDGLQSSATLC